MGATLLGRLRVVAKERGRSEGLEGLRVDGRLGVHSDFWIGGWSLGLAVVFWQKAVAWSWRGNNHLMARTTASGGL